MAAIPPLPFEANGRRFLKTDYGNLARSRRLCCGRQATPTAQSMPESEPLSPFPNRQLRCRSGSDGRAVGLGKVDVDSTSYADCAVMTERCSSNRARAASVNPRSTSAIRTRSFNPPGTLNPSGSRPRPGRNTSEPSRTPPVPPPARSCGSAATWPASRRRRLAGTSPRSCGSPESACPPPRRTPGSCALTGRSARRSSSTGARRRRT